MHHNSDFGRCNMASVAWRLVVIALDYASPLPSDNAMQNLSEVHCRKAKVRYFDQEN